MASGERQRQKKREEKSKKRRLVAKSATRTPSLGRKAVQSPIRASDCCRPRLTGFLLGCGLSACTTGWFGAASRLVRAALLLPWILLVRLRLRGAG